MELSKWSARILRIPWIFLLFMAPATGGGQENERKIPVAPPPKVAPKPARPAAVRPVPKPVPARVQPQVQQRPTPPPRPVQPRGNLAAVNPAGGQGTLPAAQLNRGRGSNLPAGRIATGAHPPGAPGGGGVNSSGLRLPPNARSMAMPGGGTAVIHPDGRRWVVDNNQHVQAFSRPGLQAKFDANGKLSAVHVVRPNNNMMVLRSVRGERGTIGMRPGGVLVVTFGRGRGYVQRPIPGRVGYSQRASLADGRPQVHVYRAYRYGGVVYVRYLPAYSYQPRFYQWASNPWPAPAAYTWSWSQAPWSSFYASYFAPAPAYPSAASWLTDYLLAANLQLAYQNHQEYEQLPANSSPPSGSGQETAPLSPEVKNAIAQEVQGQVADEQADSAQPGAQAAAVNGQAPPPALDPNQRTFVVSLHLDVVQAGEPCALTPGDVIYRTGDNLAAGNKVAVNVLSSKAGDCRANTPTEIDLVVLQEMHNQFQEQIDAGLSTLASSQGQGGLPPGPAADARPIPGGTAQPDGDVATTLAQQQADADQAEGAATDGANAVGLM